MADDPSTRELRVELSNLRDDLAVIGSSAIFSKSSIGDLKPLNAMRDRIAVIESILDNPPDRGNE